MTRGTKHRQQAEGYLMPKETEWFTGKTYKDLHILLYLYLNQVLVCVKHYLPVVNSDFIS